MPIEQRKMPFLLTCSALALILAASGCSDHKNAELKKSSAARSAPPMEIKFNAPPVARAGTDLIVKVGDVVSLNGTQSSDPDHDLMTFNWTQVAGPKVELINADTSSPTFVAPASKTPLEFSLVVNDGQTDSEPAKVKITVSNRAPVANAGRTIIAQRGSTISLDGGASVDPDNDKISYKWEQVYGPVVSVTGADTPNPVFTMPNASGYIIFALTVSDGIDESVADTVAIKITNTPPVAHVEQKTDNIDAGTKVTLDGTGSKDSDGDKLSYHWRQILGTPVLLHNSDSATPSFKAPNRPDDLVFQLTVSDGEFNSFPDSTVISVKNAPKQTEKVPDKTIISQVKEKQKGLTVKEKNLPVLPLTAPPKPVNNFLKDMAKDFKPDTSSKSESKHTDMMPKSSSSMEMKHTSGHKAHWSYQGDTDPSHWASLDKNFSTCATGKSQSPINIQTTGLKRDSKPIEFNYSTSKLNIVNNGHTVQVNYDKGSQAIINGKPYNLLQFHFHAPSENKIDSKPADMVAHMVHKADDGQLAVIAVLFKKGAENQFLKPIWDNLPTHPGMKATVDKEIYAADMLPKNKAYYHFTGSLTTPPCSENVNWNVMATTMEASAEQIDTFYSLFPKSVRPVQALNGRNISYN